MKASEAKRVPEHSLTRSTISIACLTARACTTLALSGLAFGAMAQAFEAPGDGVYKDRVDWGVMMDMSGPTSGSQSIWANGFQDYMKSIGKLGGQNKIPRLSNDRKIADQLNILQGF